MLFLYIFFCFIFLFCYYFFTYSDSILLVFGHAVITFLQLSAVIFLVGYVNYRTGLTPNELIEHG